jgi:predicted methyltransferase
MSFDLYLGDCLELMKNIPDQSVDLVLCDLPYGTTACAWDAVIPFENLWSEYRRVTKPNSAIVLTASCPEMGRLLMRGNDLTIDQVRYDRVMPQPLTAAPIEDRLALVVRGR